MFSHKKISEGFLEEKEDGFGGRSNKFSVYFLAHVTHPKRKKMRIFLTKKIFEATLMHDR